MCEKCDNIEEKSSKVEKHLCEYGCGREGKFLMSSGKSCCSKNVNSCPKVREKNSNSNKNVSKITKVIKFDNFEKILCEYGCNEIAKYKIGLKKKLCCREDPKKCKAVRTKNSNKLKGRIYSKETREKMSKSRTGIKLSKETREKMRMSRLGNKNPNYGKFLTFEELNKNIQNYLK